MGIKSGEYGKEWAKEEELTHLGSSQSELIAWTFCVMLSGDMSVKLGSLLCTRSSMKVSETVSRSRIATPPGQGCAPGRCSARPAREQS